MLLLRLFRTRDLRVLFIGQLLNMFGNTTMVLVLGIWVKSLTGSSAEAGLIFLLLAVPTLFAPLTGLLVDRFPRRIVLLFNDSCAAVLMTMLVFVHSAGQVWLIFLVTLGYGFSSQIYRAARGGLVHSMTPKDQLGDVNAMFSALNQALRIAGPLVGAGIFTVAGGGVVALLDVATFIGSVVSYLMLRGVPDLDRPKETEPMRWGAEMLAGLKHVLGTSVLRQMVIASAIAFAGAGMIDVAMFALVDRGLHRQPAFIGVLGSVQGAGAVLGALLVAWMLRRFGEFSTASVGFLLNGLGLAAAATATVPGAALGEFLVGFGLPLVLVAEINLVQKWTPKELQGRAISASEGIIDVPFTIAIAVGAGVIGAVGFFPIYAAEAVVFTLVGLAMLRLRAVTRPTAPEPTALVPDSEGNV
jgi:MFS family permease